MVPAAFGAGQRSSNQYHSICLNPAQAPNPGDHMHVTPLDIPGAWLFKPVVHSDERGSFTEYFRRDVVEQHVGHTLALHQANWSKSMAGAVRGIHFADIPPGQAKYVTCVHGAILDVVLDIRIGSPTFGRWDSAVLDEDNQCAMYVAEGLGHAFMALSDDTNVLYLTSAPYAPDREHGINPLDPALNIDWPTTNREGHPLTPTLSPKDTAAPSLAQGIREGILPTYEQAIRFYAELARN